MDNDERDCGGEDRPASNYGECQGCHVECVGLEVYLLPGGGDAELCSDCGKQAVADRALIAKVQARAEALRAGRAA